MKVKFGEFEEVEEPTKVKEFLTAYFEKLNLKEYESIFIAYPHQCYSEDYESTKSISTQLELYLYSLPKEISAADPRSINELNFGGVYASFFEGQKDFLFIRGELPSTYKRAIDLNGTIYAIQKDNKVWLLSDLFHQYGVATPVIKENITIVFDQLHDTLLDPPSPEELENRFCEAFSKSISSYNDSLKQTALANLKAFEANTKEAEDRIRTNFQKISQERLNLEWLETNKTPDIRPALQRLKKMPLTKSIEFIGKTIKVSTNPIKMGPFEFGKWNITLKNDVAAFTHEASGVALHPYEYHGTGNFCMGGWTKSYLESMQKGEIDTALAICKMEIVNYESSTKMNCIEPFLRKIMGPKKFDEHIADVVKENFKNADSAIIAQINGKEVTYIGTKMGSQTSERAVINYD